MTDNKDIISNYALSIASAMANASAGERAAARRMDARGSPLFWRLFAKENISHSQEVRWKCFTRMIALLTPSSVEESIHERSRRFGSVLADGGDAHGRLDQPIISEQRFAKLLASRGEARRDALERSVRMIARSRPKIDVVDLAWIVFRENNDSLARAYYARLDRPQQISK